MSCTLELGDRVLQPSTAWRGTGLLALLLLASCGRQPECGCVAVRPGDLRVPSALDFGNVLVGQQVTLQLPATNEGAGLLSVLPQTITGDTTSSFSEPTPVDMTLQPGSTSDGGAVQFAPTRAGRLTAQLVLDNDGTPSPVTVMLEGTGVAEIDVTCVPTAIAFGSVAVGVQPPPTAAFTCTNHGSTIIDLAINPSSTANAFSVSDANGPVSASNPRAIGPGEWYAVDVSFGPASAGEVTSSFGYTLCAGPTSCAEAQSVAVDGTGVLADGG